jgi:hypothetical protein
MTTIDIPKFLSKNPSVTKVVVNQTWGLGDILFIERLYAYLTRLGLRVTAPVQDQYIWIQEHIPYVDFRRESEFKMDYERFDFGLQSIGGEPQEDTIYLPTKFSDQIYRGLSPHDPSASRHWMNDKYRLLGLDPSEWQGLTLVRNPSREQELMRLVLGGIDGEYDFCNLSYHNMGNLRLSPSVIRHRDGGRPLVEMRKIEGYTMVDWSGVIERAVSVHTVSTSLLYMVHPLHRPGMDFHLYPRLPETGFYTVDDLLPEYWKKETA